MQMHTVTIVREIKAKTEPLIEVHHRVIVGNVRGRVDKFEHFLVAFILFFPLFNDGVWLERPEFLQDATPGFSSQSVHDCVMEGTHSTLLVFFLVVSAYHAVQVLCPCFRFPYQAPCLWLFGFRHGRLGIIVIISWYNTAFFLWVPVGGLT